MSLEQNTYTQEQLFPTNGKPRPKSGRPKKYQTDEERDEALRKYRREYYKEYRAINPTPTDYKNTVRDLEEENKSLRQMLETIFCLSIDDPILANLHRKYQEKYETQMVSEEKAELPAKIKIIRKSNP